PEDSQACPEAAHAPRFPLDAGHRAFEVRRSIAGTALEKLRVGLYGREGGSQLVRGVGDESAQALFRGRALGERPLDLGKHHIQRRAEASDLRAAVSLLDAAAEISRGDGARGLLDPPQR